MVRQNRTWKSKSERSWEMQGLHKGMRTCGRVWTKKETKGASVSNRDAQWMHSRHEDWHRPEMVAMPVLTPDQHRAAQSTGNRGAGA